MPSPTDPTALRLQRDTLETMRLVLAELRAIRRAQEADGKQRFTAADLAARWGVSPDAAKDRLRKVNALKTARGKRVEITRAELERVERLFEAMDNRQLEAPPKALAHKISETQSQPEGR
jgi:hypothetical protein